MKVNIFGQDDVWKPRVWTAKPDDGSCESLGVQFQGGPYILFDDSRDAAKVAHAILDRLGYVVADWDDGKQVYDRQERKGWK